MRKIMAMWLSFFAFAFVVRLPVFGLSVVDHDESLYLIMGQDLLNGHLPFLQTFDHKPPLLYYLFATAEFLFGPTVEAGRLLAVTCVSTTATLLVAGARQFGWTRFSFVAGVLYVLFSLANGGLAANNEITFAPFVALALYAGLRAVKTERPALWSALFGVAAGAAVGIKFVTAFDLMGIAGVVFASTHQRHAHSLARWGQILAVGAVSAVATVFVTLLPHLVAGYGGLLFQNLVTYNRAYAGFDIGSDVARWSLVSAQGFLGASVPLVGAVYLALKNQPYRLISITLLAWLLLDVISVGLMGRYFPHHFLQTVPALSLMGALLSEHFPALKVPLGPGPLVAALALVLGTAGSLREMRPAVRNYVKPLLGLAQPEPDVPREIARIFAARRGTPDATLFVYNYQPVIYYLTNASRPTLFAFSDFLASDYPLTALGTDASREVYRIGTSSPDWVVFQSPRPIFHNEKRWDLVRGWLDRYEVVASWPVEGGRARVELLHLPSTR